MERGSLISRMCVAYTSVYTETLPVPGCVEGLHTHCRLGNYLCMHACIDNCVCICVLCRASRATSVLSTYQELSVCLRMVQCVKSYECTSTEHVSRAEGASAFDVLYHES